MAHPHLLTHSAIPAYPGTNLTGDLIYQTRVPILFTHTTNITPHKPLSEEVKIYLPENTNKTFKTGDSHSSPDPTVPQKLWQQSNRPPLVFLHTAPPPPMSSTLYYYSISPRFSKDTMCILQQRSYHPAELTITPQPRTCVYKKQNPPTPPTPPLLGGWGFCFKPTTTPLFVFVFFFCFVGCHNHTDDRFLPRSSLPRPTPLCLRINAPDKN